MSEFKLVQHAMFSPTACAACGTHEGPFIDTEIDLPAYGHVYLCASRNDTSGCIRQMARLDGMIESVTVIGTIQNLEDDLRVAREEIERERAHKVVPMAEVLTHISRSKRRPADDESRDSAALVEPEPEPARRRFPW